jgi:hypothetical protein
MKSSWRFIGFTFLIGIWLALSIPLRAETPPLPLPTPGLRPLQIYATANITFPRSESVIARGLNGRFETVGIHFHEIAEIDFQVPDNRATTVLHVQALDGGIITGDPKDKTAGADSTASFKFHAPGKPGVYRVLISSSAGPFILPFWITDPDHPGNKRPVINPTH